jgi:cytochrome P450
LDLGGKHLDQGHEVLVLMGAANRDPERFPDPDRLDITRQDNRHLSFGQGPHFCLGSPLARLEGQIAISTLLRRMPNLRLETEELEWQQTQALHGLKALPVAF